jgi:dTDP-4-dehydrorhamnose 3,5-epimerase
MEVIPTPFPEVLLIKPKIYHDNRGFFYESHQQSKYKALGIESVFVQDNISFSKKGVLRGLHYQLEHAQDKLVHVIAGAVFDVVVDVRHGSPTFGQWMGQILSDENHLQLFVPKGFAHGFCVLSDQAHFVYKCSDYYNPTSEFGIIWNDPAVKVEWPIENPILSEKDALNPSLRNVSSKLLPHFKSSVIA